MRTLIVIAVLALSVAGRAENAKHRPAALVLLIDRSGSMQGPSLDAAKSAVLAAVDALDPTDQVSVITFDSEAKVVVPLQAAAGHKQIAQQVANIDAGGGTALLPALTAALAALADNKAAIKHVLLLSDGQSPSEGVSELIAKLRAANVTISTVGVGDAERAMLTKISDAGAGRDYFVANLKFLPKVFARDVADALH